jgi:hypothetical protein
MKIRFAAIVFYVLLPSSDVSAKTPSHGTIHHQRTPHRFDQNSGYAPAPARRAQISHQFYPNPDRDLFGPNPNCGGSC